MKKKLSSLIEILLPQFFNKWMVLMLISIISLSFAFGQGDPTIISYSLPISACNKSIAEDIQITIGNTSSPFTPIASNTMTAHYSVDGGPTVSQPIAVGLFAPGATLVLTFTVKANLSACGPHTINTWLTYTGTDANPANNSRNWTIQNDCTVIPGNVTTSTTVCQGLNSGTLNLTGWTYGSITDWQSSTDGGTIWSNLGNPGSTSYNYNNVPVNTLYRVQIEGGYCPDANSASALITAQAPPVAGSVSSSATLCENSSGSLTLSGSVGAVNFWESSTDGMSWNNIVNTSTTENYSSLTATTWYRAQIEGGACGDVYATPAILTIDPATVAGTLSADQTICEGNSVNLSLAGHTGAIQNWEWSTDGILWNNIATTSSNYTTPILTSTTRYRVNVKSGVCATLSSNEVIITVDPLPVAGSVSSSATLCENSSGSLTLSGSVGAVNFWESSTDGMSWNNIVNTSTTENYSSITATTWYRAQIEGGACADVYATPAILTIDPATVAGTLSADQTICEGNSVNLSLAGHTGAIQNWEWSTDGILWNNIATTSSNYTTPILTSTTRYRVNVKSGVCATRSSNEVIITVDPLPVAGSVSSSATLCENSSGSLTLSGSVGAVNFWESSVDGMSWNNIVNTSTTENYSSITATTWYRAQIEGGACGDVYATAAILTIDPATVAGTLSADQTICEGNSVNLSLAGHTGAIQNWEWSTDGILWNNIATTSSNYTTPILTSTTRYRVNVKSGVCTTLSSNEVIITVDPLPVAGSVSSSATLCENSSGSLTLSGSVGAVNFWESSADGMSWNNIVNTSTTENYASLSATTWYRAQIEGGACADVYATAAILSIDPATVAGTLSADQTICEGNSVNLSLAAYTGVIQNWEWSLDGISWTSLSYTSNSYTTPILTSTTRYRVNVKSGVCATLSSNEVIITVDPLPVAGSVSSSATLCENSSGSLTLSGSVGAVNFWESSTDGMSWNNIVNTSTTENYASLTATTWYRAQIEGGACGDLYATAAILTIDPATVAGTLSADQSICEGNTANLSLAGYTGSIVNWEWSLDGISWTSLSNTSNSYTTPILTNTTRYRVNVQSGICSLVASNTVIVTVDQNPVAGSLSSSTICENVTGNLNITGSVGAVNFWEFSTDGGISWNNISNTSTSQIYFGLTSDTWYRAQIDGGACADVYTPTAILTVNPKSVAGVLGMDQTICEGGTVSLALTANVGSVLDWEVSNDNIIWTSVGNTANTFASPILATTSYYRVIVASGVCPSDTSNVTLITVNPQPIGGNIAGSATLCAATASGTLTLTGSAGIIADWEYSNDFGTTWVPIGNNLTTYNFSALTDTTWYRVGIGGGVCPWSYSDTAVINVLEDSYGGVLTSNNTICEGTVDVLQLTGNIGSNIIWEESPDMTTWTPVATNVSTLNITPIQTTFYHAVVSNGACPSSTSNSVTIQVNPSPVVSAGADVIITEGDTITLNGFGGAVGMWSPPTQLSDPNLSNPLASPTSTIIYTYTGMNTNGCSNSAKVTVTVLPKAGIDIKNVVTANNDGYNDVWFIDGLDLSHAVDVKVFDIHNNEVYSKENYQNDWDGSYRGNKLPNGTYYYVVEMLNSNEIYKGTLTILGNE